MNKETKNEVTVIPASVQEKYFLISKRRAAIWLVVMVVLYLFVVLSSEFVFSVSTSSEKSIAEYKKDMQRLPCSWERYRVDSGKVPKRNPWLLERYGRGGEYLDVLYDQPNCAALSAVGALTDPHGKFSAYYFDRATDKPVIKVTYESLK